MTENTEYTQSTDTERELRDHAVSALRTTHTAWYGENFEGWSTEQIRTVERIFRKVSVPLDEARNAVNSWLEDNKSDYHFNPTLIELFDALEEPLGIEVNVYESIDVKIEATVKFYRKAWENKDALVESITDNLSVDLTLRHRDLEIDDYEIDTIEEA